MRQPDEIEFYAAIRAKGRGVFADVVAEQIGMGWGRAERILEDWEKRGWWACGITLRAGWLTDSAPGGLTQ